MPEATLLDRPTIAGPVIPWHSQSAVDRLIERVGESDTALAADINALIEPYQRRIRSNVRAPMRKEKLVEFARSWRTKLNADSRLGIDVQFDADKRGVTILDCRAIGLRLALADWPNEPC